MTSQLEISSAKSDDIISKKMSALLSISYTDRLLSQSLETLDSQIKENTLDARRYLRSSIEAEVLQNGQSILKRFDNVASILESVGEQLHGLSNLYNTMEIQLEAVSRETASANSESMELLGQKQKIRDRSTLLNAFCDSFVISDDEIEILTNPGIQVDEKFFTTLSRVKNIYTNCQVLLVDGPNETDTSGSQNGFSIMNQMTSYLDKAYDKLLYSLNHHFRSMSGGAFQISKVMRKSLITLAERPSLLESAVNSLYDQRAKTLQMEFTNALTVASKSTKPLDFFAYDIIRYVGDMMAWIHSAALSEQENLDALFDRYDENISLGLEKGAQSEPWKHIDTKIMMHSLLDKATTLLVKLTRTRVEKSVLQEKNIATIYELYNLLQFYQVMFDKHNLITATALGDLFDQLQQSTMRRLRALLEEKISIIKSKYLIKTEQLEPPEFLTDALADLKSILNSYQSSISYSVTGDNTTRQLLEDMTEPYLECCNRISSDLSSPSAEIFMINCYDLTKSTLALFSIASYKVDQMENRIEELAQALSEIEFRRFIRASGLDTIDSADRDNIHKAASVLDDFLPAATMDSSLQLHALSSPRLASSITLRASKKFADKFNQVKQQLCDIYDDCNDLFPRSLDEVLVLLALD